MPVHTRGMNGPSPKSGGRLLNSSGLQKVQRSAAKTSRLLTSNCLADDSESESDSSTTTEGGDEDGYDFSSQSEGVDGVDVKDPRSEDSDNDVIFVAERKIADPIVSGRRSTSNKYITKEAFGNFEVLDLRTPTNPTYTFLPASSQSSSESRRFLYSSDQERVSHTGPPSRGISPERETPVVVCPAGCPPCGSKFKSFPPELHQKIALLLPTDADVAHYALICKTSCNSVTNSLWCLRFKDTFDRPIDIDATDTSRLANVYKVRSEVSRGYSCFTLSDGGRQNGEKLRLLSEVKVLHNPNYLRMLHELIRQSNAVRQRTPDGREVMAGLNLDFVRELIMIPKNSERHLDILDAIHETHDLEFWSPRKIVTASKRESLVLVIQLCLAHLVLDPNIPNKIGGLDLGQHAAYSDHEKQPMFLGKWKQDINIRWVLSTLSFFQVQFLSDEDGALTHEYAALEQDQLPQPWLGRLQDETQTIGSHWKGAYTWLDHDKLIKFRRSGRDDGDFFVDSAEDFHDLSIFFDESRFSTEAWPRDFEILLSTDPYVSDLGPPTPKPDRALRSFGGNKAVHRTYPLRSFFGTARDQRKPSHLYGRIHALPPQQKIPGFQRISFLKFCYTDEGEYDPDQVWGYEGCVLPGGRIIIGRWFDATFHFAHSDVEPVKWFSGPFIYWNVDRCAAEDPILPQEALDFLAHLNDLGIGKRSTFPS